jgi:hypothetical protein
MEGLNMRILKYALALMLPAGILLADSSLAGNWKMNHDKSKYTKGDLPKDESMNISDQNSVLHVTITGTDDTGKPIAITYVVPVSGGAGQMQPGGSYNGVSAKHISDSTEDMSYTKDGKQLVAQHMVVATDGKTMTVTVKGVDADGNPVEGVLVFDHQPGT